MTKKKLYEEKGIIISQRKKERKTVFLVQSTVNGNGLEIKEEKVLNEPL